MAQMNISVPDGLKQWAEQRVAQGDYASTSDYLRDLMRRDREAAAEAAWLQAELDRGVESGVDPRPVKQIFRPDNLVELLSPYEEELIQLERDAPAFGAQVEELGHDLVAGRRRRTHHMRLAHVAELDFGSWPANGADGFGDVLRGQPASEQPGVGRRPAGQDRPVDADAMAGGASGAGRRRGFDRRKRCLCLVGAAWFEQAPGAHGGQKACGELRIARVDREDLL
eukprot:gene5662-7686_t